MKKYIYSIAFLILFAVSVQAQTLTNSASFEPGNKVSNHELVTMFGVNLSPVTMQASTIPLPTDIGGIEILVKNPADNFSGLAQLHFVSPGQINFVFPEFVSGAVTIYVYRNGLVTHFVNAVVDAIIPGIFVEAVTYPQTAQYKAPSGSLLAYKNGSVTYHPLVTRTGAETFLKDFPVFDPASVYFLSIYGTGIKYSSNFPFKTLVLTNTATGTPYRVDVDYSGPSNAYIGLDLVNIRISNANGYVVPAGTYSCFVEYKTFVVTQVYKTNTFNIKIQ